MNPTFERALWASTPALRCLAPLDAILAPLQLSVAQLKAKERYAEDVF